MTDSLPADASARFLVGIDLGTTNSALAFVDTAEAQWAVRDLVIGQLVGPAQVEGRELLPSFHYEPAESEFDPAALHLPWSTADDRQAFVGTFARDHGALAPGRLVASAKSWLSHSGVDRTAGLLPWHGAADVQKLSPVEISSRYLGHLRAAWDAAHPEYPLAQQDVVLAVPASFDEVARELTIQAAQRAGLARIALVEEPQAAFYAWISTQGANWDRSVRAGQTILVCDVGGGTSDFTLIRVRPAANGSVVFHRVAVGEHLILGGDNLDLALAHHVEKRLDAGKLRPGQWATLLRTCRRVKETFLGPDAPSQLTVSIAAGGASLIGGALQVKLERTEVEELLIDGFLPKVELLVKPAARRSGFHEFGLPYAADPGITRYLAAFLSAHPDEVNGSPARPDMVLFNGGLFESPALRQRLLDVLSSWFSSTDAKWSPTVLRNERMELAVSRGAAYYAMVRRGRGVRITGGLAHSYYLGVDTEEAPMAVCLLPAGVEQGQTIDLSARRFSLRIRQPAEFPLYYSSTRTTDAPGQLIAVDPEQLSALPPICTVLQSGRGREGAQMVSVQLQARLTEVGTLDIWCVETDGAGRWKLQFDVRASTRSDIARHRGHGESLGVVDEQTLTNCQEKIRELFGRQSGQSPAGIMKSLEQVSGLSRQDWPPTLLRGLWETTLDAGESRKAGVEHESRWLGLVGFFLRPGYGMAMDDWRAGKTWRLFQGGTAQPKNEFCRAEWWILWRRIAGGLSSAQQALIGEPLAADWRTFFRKGGVGVRGRSPQFQFGRHESAEVWRLLGSLELVRPALKAELAGMILERLPREKTPGTRDAMLFALGRLGARQPVYGPLNALVSADEVEQWIGRLLESSLVDERAVFAVVQMARRTGDRYRDISDSSRDAASAWLKTRGAAEHLLELVRIGGTLQDQEQRSVFGESLPRGLRIE